MTSAVGHSQPWHGMFNNVPADNLEGEEMNEAWTFFMVLAFVLFIFAMTLPLWYNKLYYKLKGKNKRRPPRQSHSRIARNNEHAA
jgi:hypothetical protein